jgi:hypothetical protein
MNTTTFYDSVLFPFINNDNILIYNGELLPENIKENVTRSIENLMNHTRNVYVSKIYRSNHCIWFILVKNIPDIFILNSIKNTLSIAENNTLLKDTLVSYPQILFNININYNSYPIYNLLHNIGSHLSVVENLETLDRFDLLG